MARDVDLLHNAYHIIVGGEEDIIVINIIGYHKPSAIPLIVKPVIHWLEVVRLRVIAAGKFNFSSNISIAVLKSGSVACV